MKPWITLAIGTQKVAEPSSVVQPDFATSEKFAIAVRPVRSASLPLLKRSRLASNGRQVIRSPAEPASSLEFSAALYSVGAEGVKSSLMPGWLASKAGMICSCQIARSSLRQLSIVSVTSWAKAAEPASSVVPSSAPFSGVVLIRWFSLLVGRSPRFTGRPGARPGPARYVRRSRRAASPRRQST